MIFYDREKEQLVLQSTWIFSTLLPIDDKGNKKNEFLFIFKDMTHNNKIT